MTVRLELPQGSARFFNGICVHLTQGESDPNFTDYQLDLAPKVWLLSKRSQSRIFQHVAVPDILKKVFAGFDVEYQISGTFEKRDYCVQYRETDFNFASRLMEEEGIYYFFKHADGKHTMVLANTPQSHPSVQAPTTIIYKTVNQEASTDEDNISELSKVQEQTSGKFTLWDHTFELPHEHLQADKPITSSVTVGKVAHKLTTGDNGNLEIYDWPGEYAQRFDGIDKGGGEQPGDLTKIFTDNKRTVELRMQQEASAAVVLRGAGSARQLSAGYKFTLATLSTDPVVTPIKAEGEYVVTSVTHSVHVPATYRSGGQEGYGFRYRNTFAAIPSAVPFRPERATPKPVISGTQTAVVVGPSGEEIFTDKYGRVKVQFHWDREGQRNADSSCWVRVAPVFRRPVLGHAEHPAGRPGSHHRLPRRGHRPAGLRRVRVQPGPDADVQAAGREDQDVLPQQLVPGRVGVQRTPVRGQGRPGADLLPRHAEHGRTGPERQHGAGR
ncbi:type VI secretion protein [Fimbriiglobus ruber]|uniref:Type VI secretion protein n=1 Tax=Fimbriiglobus ruber TaxID=1908690 RepID=A0A225E5R9_9BACT|nr:type VI secretion protein [Fimbriiglobus ruber]